MRKLFLGGIAGVGLICAGALASGAGGSAPDDRPVCATTKFDGTCEVKPNKLVAGARAVIRKIHWRSWGGRHAVGVGTLRIFPSAGLPDDELTSKARIEMGFIQTCDGRRRYQKAPFTFTDNEGDQRKARALVFRCGDFKEVTSGPRERAAATARPAFAKCPGTISWDDHGGHSTAANIRARGLTCTKAKKVIKAPATDRGYDCERIGEGGNVGRILCRKPPKAVRFDFSTD